MKLISLIFVLLTLIVQSQGQLATQRYRNLAISRDIVVESMVLMEMKGCHYDPECYHQGVDYTFCLEEDLTYLTFRYDVRCS